MFFLKLLLKKLLVHRYNVFMASSFVKKEKMANYYEHSVPLESVEFSSCEICQSVSTDLIYCDWRGQN